MGNLNTFNSVKIHYIVLIFLIFGSFKKLLGVPIGAQWLKNDEDASSIPGLVQ